jgi:hypothetical protein
MCETWVREAGLGIEDVFEARMTPALGDVLQRLAATGEAALAKLRGLSFPMGATPALSAAATVRVRFRDARSPGFDPFRAAPEIPQWRRVARIAYANLTWRI